MNLIKKMAAVLLVAFAGHVEAALTETVARNVGRPIPDDPNEGAGDTLEYVGGILGTVPNAQWAGLRVNLEIAGGYNGDLYVYLEHGTDYAVLLNRVGRSAQMEAGYGDSGFRISLDDAALNGDIHRYRTVVNPAGGTLTGRWQPDGRDTLAEVALDTDPRTAMLSGLVHGSPDGEWSLTVVDVSPGDQARLVSWGLEFVYTAPPEISVRDGGAPTDPEIASGQATPVDFGTTAVGVPVARTFTISNAGHDGLAITGIVVPAGYRLVGAPGVPFTVPAQGAIPIEVVLEATAAGSFPGDILVASSDSDEGAYRIPVTGVADGNRPVITRCAMDRELVLVVGNSLLLPDLRHEVEAEDVEPGTLFVRQSPEPGTPLPIGSTEVAVIVADAAGNETACFLQVTVVRLPVVGGDFGETVAGVPATFRVAKLLSNDVDPDGGVVSFAGVDGTSSGGGSVIVVGDDIVYSPANGFVGSDTFSYRIQAGGRIGSGTVTVRVRTSDAIPSNAVYLRPAAAPLSGMEMRFAGIAGRSYSVQFTTELGTGWTELARLVAKPGSGFIDHVHAAPPDGAGFYRCLPAN